MNTQIQEVIDPHIRETFQFFQSLGQGGYGKVWKVQLRQNSTFLALKKIYDAFKNVQDAQRTYREIKYLQQLHHPNIVGFHSFYLSELQPDIYIAFEHMESDLNSAIRSGVLKEIHKHFIFYQIVNGLHYLHSAQLIHRDMKPANILVNQNCQVKICDFGLVRSISSSQPGKDLQLTENIATRWYRAPEILLCTNNYGKAADIWGLGCILAEVFIGQPIFKGSSAISQLQKIFEVTGKPSREDLYFVKSQASKSIVESMNIECRRSLLEITKRKDKYLLDLLQRIFVVDPSKRITISQILEHPFVNVFKGKVEEKMVVQPIKVLYDEKKLNPESYKMLLISELEEKAFHSGSQPSTFHDSVFKQSLRSNRSDSMKPVWPFETVNRFKNEKQPQRCFGSKLDSFGQNVLPTKQPELSIVEPEKIKKQKLPTEQVLMRDKSMLPSFVRSRKVLNPTFIKTQKGQKFDQLQKEKQRFLLQFRRSTSPKLNPQHRKKGHLSQDKLTIFCQDDLQPAQEWKKPATFGRQTCKRVQTFKSHSPSPTNLIDPNFKKDFLKKQKAVPKFILNKTQLRSKSPQMIKHNLSSRGIYRLPLKEEQPAKGYQIESNKSLRIKSPLLYQPSHKPQFQTLIKPTK